MTFSFQYPLLVYLSAALALLAAGLYVWRRKPAASLFLGAASCLVLLASGLSVRTGGAPIHAAVLDVSSSMESRLSDARPFFTDERERTGETFAVWQLSDTLRNDGDPVGGRTSYAALQALAGKGATDGDVVLLTDGQGRLDQLLNAVDVSRLVLLRAPAPGAPDASILHLKGPSIVLPGATGTLVADIRCDRDAPVVWRIFGQEGEQAHERRVLKAGVPQRISHSFLAPQSGILKLRLVVECEGDREPRNNTATLAVAVGGKRVVYYARGRTLPEDADALAALLRSDSRNELRVADSLPASQSALEGVHLVVINDLALPQSGLSRDGLGPLAQWVREGGRLLMAGARDSFGPGGWRGSAVEELMPVTFRPDDDPARRYVLLLDCSDSMRASVGGQTRLDLLKQAANRVLDSLDERDTAAVVAFSQAPDAVEFVPLRNLRALKQRVDQLTTRTTTHIHAALSAALRAMPPGAKDRNRVLLITDGEDNEGAGDEAWAQLGAIAKQSAEVDVVLTENINPPWLARFRAAGAAGATAGVGERGFANILNALEQALRGSEEALLDDGSGHGGFLVNGRASPLEVLCRTASRPELRPGEVMLEARTPPGDWKQSQWPLLARREMTGRTVAICTSAHGAIWRHDAFVDAVEQALAFLLSGVEQPSLQLNASDDGADLLWVGIGDAPVHDLQLDNGQVARKVSTGLWRLDEYPRGDQALVSAGGKLIARIPLAQAPSRELARTGDDEAFFAVAQQRGVRVLNSLADWHPQKHGGRQERNLSWVAGLLAVAFVLAAFALRRR